MNVSESFTENGRCVKALLEKSRNMTHLKNVVKRKEKGSPMDWFDMVKRRINTDVCHALTSGLPQWNHLQLQQPDQIGESGAPVARHVVLDGDQGTDFVKTVIKTISKILNHSHV